MSSPSPSHTLGLDWLRAQALDNMRFTASPDVTVSVVVTYERLTGIWHAFGFHTKLDVKKSIASAEGSDIRLAMQKLFLKTATLAHFHLPCTIPKPTIEPPSAAGPSPAGATEDSVHESSSDDSDWEELGFQVRKPENTNKLLNKYKTAHRASQKTGYKPLSPVSPPPAAAVPQQQQQQQRQRQSSPPRPPAPRLPQALTRSLTQPSRPAATTAAAVAATSHVSAPPPPPPPPPFHTRPRILPPLIPPPLPVRLAITAPGGPPRNVLTTLARPSLRALLQAATANVAETQGVKMPWTLRAAVRRVRVEGVMCDVAGFGADDLRAFFGKGEVPFFVVEVWREMRGADDGEESDQSEIAD